MTRQDILKEAVNNCYKYMYEKSQPSADWNKILEEFKNEPEESQKKWPLYSRYYLSAEESKGIEDMFLDAYRINNPFKHNMDLFKTYLIEGGLKDKYIEAHTDEHGYHPGHRSYETVKPITVEINERLGNTEDMNWVLEKVLQRLEWCTEFYGNQREQCSFSMSMMASPNTNPAAVKAYWKEVHGIDIDIDERPYWEREEDEDCF